MTKGELKLRVQAALNDTTGVAWTESQVGYALLEAAEVLAEESRGIKRSVLVPLQEGANYYYVQAVAPDMLFPYRVWSQRDERRLTALTLKELDQYHEQWDTVTGDPEVWCPLSWDCFVLWPRPSDGGGWLRIDYVAWPQEIEDDEEWEFPDQSQDALVHYALYDSLLKYYDKEAADTHLSLFLMQGLQGSNRSGLRKDQAREWGREGFPSLSPAGPSHVRSS